MVREVPDQATTERQVALEAFYSPLAAAHDRARRNGWASTDRQKARLGLVRAALGDLTGLGSVLDAGCGEGHLLTVLRDAGWRGRYLGEDLLPHMIDAGRDAAADEGAEFIHRDLHGPGPAADGVVCSGALNTATGRPPHEEAVSAIEALWARTRVVLVVDFIAVDRHPGGRQLAPLDPMALYRHARTLTSAATLREDVMPGEAMIVLRRDRAGTWAHMPANTRLDLHLEAGELRAAEAVLPSLAAEHAALARARIDCHAGRWRRAEGALRQLTGDPGARLLLASLLFRTGRPDEATAITADLAAADGAWSDHARALAARHHGGEDGVALARSIADPWIRREALGPGDEGA